MVSPDRIEALWQYPLKPIVRTFVDSPIEATTFVDLFAEAPRDMKPGVVIAQRVIEEADMVRQLVHIQVPTFPYDTLYKLMAMPSVNLRYADKFGSGDRNDIMDMIRANARDDGTILTPTEELDIFEAMSSQTKLLERDTTGKLFMDDFEAQIPELLAKEYTDFPRSAEEDLLRLGVDRFRNYLGVLERIPLL